MGSVLSNNENETLNKTKVENARSNSRETRSYSETRGSGGKMDLNLADETKDTCLQCKKRKSVMCGGICGDCTVTKQGNCKDCKKQSVITPSGYCLLCAYTPHTCKRCHLQKELNRTTCRECILSSKDKKHSFCTKINFPSKEKSQVKS